MVMVSQGLVPLTALVICTGENMRQPAGEPSLSFGSGGVRVQNTVFSVAVSSLLSYSRLLFSSRSGKVHSRNRQANFQVCKMNIVTPALRFPVMAELGTRVQAVKNEQFREEESLQVQGPPPFLPLLLRGTVIHGFGRGSRKMGVPTANLAFEEVAHEVEEAGSAAWGVYCGWAQVPSVTGASVLPMVMNIGPRPTFDTGAPSIEVHILHEVGRDFYGEELRAVAGEYLRPQMKFASIDALVKQIMDDISTAKELLQTHKLVALRTHSLFCAS
eukprot:TRINITY_DN1299_c0_g1_i3.p1 TRINITY_DN1299_c0_g1~~TRINITY_DN1299_c0_g1_i3.p1  ORF type:complete len:281 (-),score=40.25 TRINITY_DN1299_c0_g1_i3:207-1025(-)